MSKASNEMTEHAEHAEAVYKPSEHGGLREDGQPDTVRPLHLNPVQSSLV